MKALSYQPPWGYLCATVKDIENRNWPLPRNFTLPQRIYIHQGKTWDSEHRWFPDEPFIRDCIPLHRQAEIMDHLTWMCEVYKHQQREPDILARVWGIGAIIGEVDIVGQVHTTDIGHPATKSPWFVGTYGFIQRNAVLYEHPIPCKGKLSFFEPEILDITT